MPPQRARAALARAIAVLDAAERRRRPVDLVHALGEVARAYRDLGEPASAAWYLQQALQQACTLGGVDARADLLCRLAEVEAMRADREARADGDAALARAARERSRDLAFEAADLARRCADPRWQAQVLRRVAAVLRRCGDHDDAAGLRARAARLAALARGAAAAPAAPQ